MLTLNQLQQEAVDQISNEPTCAAANASMPGVGKTVMSVEVAKAVHARTILVIAPLQVEDEFRETFALQEVDLPFQKIDSTPKGDLAKANFQWQVPGIYFVGTQMFTRLGWVKTPILDKNNQPVLDANGKPKIKTRRTTMWDTPVDMIIFDEAHAAQNSKSWTFKTLMNTHTSYKLAQSGTLTGNNFEGAFAIARWLWPDLIDPDKRKWVDRWCETTFDPFSYTKKKVVGELNPGAFFDWVPCYVRLESTVDVEVDDQTVEVDLYPEQRRAYESLVQNMLAWVQDGDGETKPLVVNFPIVQRIRLRQATLGMFSLALSPNQPPSDSGKPPKMDVVFAEDCVSSKLDVMLDRILDKDFEGEPALIFTDSEIFAGVTVARINAKYGEDSARKWSGKVKRATRDSDKQDFLDGKYKYLVAVIASIGTGTNKLQLATRNMLYLSSMDSRIGMEQSEARLIRTGQTRTVRIRRILANDTMDSGILDKHIRDAINMNATLKKRARK
jgi:hypothetical protein